ncbi:MAG TPA: hypothetical protein VMP10_04635, partial [Chloroflexota bacterium]|nr:hypothetical protein [Chloroflexota bacterium]
MIESGRMVSERRVHHHLRITMHARFLVILVVLSVLVLACERPAETLLLPTPTSGTSPVAVPTAGPRNDSAATLGTLRIPEQTPTDASTPVSRVTRTPVATSTGSPVASPTDTFSADQAFAHVRHLASRIGSRPASDENYRIAAEYVANELRS